MDTKRTLSKGILTLSELRLRIAPGSVVMKHCTAKWLREKDVLLEKREVVDSSMAVYQSGYVVYRIPCHQIVFHLNETESEYCETPGDLESLDWAIAAMYVGDRHIEQSYQRNCLKRMHYSYIPESEEDSRIDAWDKPVAISENHQSAEDEFLEKENELNRKRFISQALSMLTPLQREAIRLYYLEEMTQPEIARSLNRSRSTVDKAIRQARSRLKKSKIFARN